MITITVDDCRYTVVNKEPIYNGTFTLINAHVVNVVLVFSAPHW